MDWGSGIWGKNLFRTPVPVSKGTGSRTRIINTDNQSYFDIKKAFTVNYTVLNSLWPGWQTYLKVSCTSARMDAAVKSGRMRKQLLRSGQKLAPRSQGNSSSNSRGFSCTGPSYSTRVNKYQCCGSMAFWCGSGSADPCL